MTDILVSEALALRMELAMKAGYKFDFGHLDFDRDTTELTVRNPGGRRLAAVKDLKGPVTKLWKAFERARLPKLPKKYRLVEWRGYEPGTEEESLA